MSQVLLLLVEQLVRDYLLNNWISKTPCINSYKYVDEKKGQTDKRVPVCPFRFHTLEVGPMSALNLYVYRNNLQIIEDF